MNEYMLFLDETKKNTANSYFCVAGFSITRDDYEAKMIPQINAFKKTYFNDTSVVFHFFDMKKAYRDFGILCDSKTRTRFWADLYAILKNMPITTFGCYFDSNKMRRLYPRRNLYDIALHYIVENYAHFLMGTDGVGSVMIESRTLRENQYLHDYFKHIEANGTLFCSQNDIRKHITSVGYIVKQDNCIGLQIADFVPFSFVRAKSGMSDYHNFGKMFLDKLYGTATGDQDILGLTNVF
jgi:hypothetical protein